MRMLFSNRSQEALQYALIKASGDKESHFTQEELEEISLALLSLCSSSLKMRIRQRSIELPLPGTGELSPKRIKERENKQMSLFDTDLDGQGGGATPKGAC